MTLLLTLTTIKVNGAFLQESLDYGQLLIQIALKNQLQSI